MADKRHDEAAVAESVTLIVDRIGDRASEVIGSIQRHLAAEIVELRGDPALLELLRGSVAGNVETVFDALRYDISIERVEPPTAALEYARRVAQHGIPANALIRAYRLGQQQVLAHVLKEIRRAGLEPETALNTYETISAVAFRYIDWISQQVTHAYETERERWVENRNSVRALRVRELLDSAAGSVDIDAAIAAIGYPLRLTHLAMILWTTADDAPGRELLRLERFMRELADSMALRGALFVASDQVSGWGWLPLGSAATAGPVAHIRRFAADSADPPYLAVGTAQPGLEGFRRSHRQAQKARRVAVAGAQDRPVTAAGDPGVAVAALLTEDLTETREWVCETLGPLASDTDNDARLRETMRVFFGEGSSYKGAAERLNLHHNSIKYRVDRAVERRGRPIGDDRIDVEIALLACHHLGSAVLMAAPQNPLREGGRANR